METKTMTFLNIYLVGIYIKNSFNMKIIIRKKREGDTMKNGKEIEKELFH